MPGECLAVDSSVTTSVYALYDCDTLLEGFVCKKRKNSFFVPYVGETVPVVTGTGCLRDIVKKNYHVDGEIVDSSC